MSSSPNYAFNRSSGFTSQIWPINGRVTFHRWIEVYRRALPSNTTHTHTLTHTYTHTHTVPLFPLHCTVKRKEKQKYSGSQFGNSATPFRLRCHDVDCFASSSLHKFVTVKGGDETQSIYKQFTLLQ